MDKKISTRVIAPKHLPTLVVALVAAQVSFSVEYLGDPTSHPLLTHDEVADGLVETVMAHINIVRMDTGRLNYD